MMTYDPTHLKLWKMPDHYAGEVWPDYYSSGVGQSRDSDALERSNFTSMLALLGGESETVIVVRESHWLVGWVEWIAIHSSDAKALEIADDAKGRLNDYPVLDENHFSEVEQEDADQTWANCFDWRERIAYIREHRYQFEFHNYRDMLGCIRGQYFVGYPGDLLT